MKDKSVEAVKEACLFAGFISFCCGIWLIYPPAALIVGGLCLMWIGLPPVQKGGGS
ncbi:MAG: hypothetical protein K6T83_22855 [Alicyclobacillus sp.]|nr:hypothetical protein [Alicyclobacillus sp.]